MLLRLIFHSSAERTAEHRTGDNKSLEEFEGLRVRMSALGQKQTCAAQKGMSALTPKATANAT